MAKNLALKPGTHVSIKEKSDGTATIMPIQPEESLDTRLDMLKFLTEVQSRIKTEITEDFVLAKLENQDKEAVIEMTVNAFYCRRLIRLIQVRAKHFPRWSKTEQTWITRPLNEEELALANEHAQQMFDTYMNRIFMTVILARNVERNPLMQLLADSKADEDISSVPQEEKTMAQNFIDKLRGIDKKQESED